MAKRLKVATEMMGADAGFHPDQAWPYIGEPRFDLAARPLLPQHDAAAPILADEVERILADIDPDYGDFAIEFLGHGVLLCLRCSGQLAFLAGLERRSWPDETERVLADIDPDYGDFAIEFLGHGVLLCLGCPGQLPLLAGLEHRSWPDETERVLAEINPDYGDFATKFRGNCALLCLRCPRPAASAGGGLEHGRTIP